MLSLVYVTLEASASLVVTGGSLSLASMTVPPAVLGAAMTQLSGMGSTLKLSAVTVLGQREEFAGTLTIAQDGSMTTDSANLQGFMLHLPHFTIRSGPCTVSEGGRCVGRPEGYRANERCTIIVGGVGGVLGGCGVFDTYTDSDLVTLPDSSNHLGSDCPVGAVLATGDTVRWSSDSEYQGCVGDTRCDNGCTVAGLCGLPYSQFDGLGGGWQICF